jgi:hypothetical protein
LKKSAPPAEAPSPAEAKELKAAATERAPRKKIFILAGAGVGVLAIAAGIFFFLTKEPPPPPPKPRPVAPKQTPATNEAKTPPVSTAGKAVAKANDVAAAVANGQTAAVNDVLAANAPKSAAPNTNATATTPTATATANPASATEQTHAPTPAISKPVGPVAPSATFKAWVQNLKISGVRGGANPRVFIERTSYAPGDLVNPQLGITFEGYDAETRMLRFKDKSGAVVERRN